MYEKKSNFYANTGTALASPSQWDIARRSPPPPLPDSEEASIGDEAAAVEGDVKLLRTDVPQGKVLIRLLNHELEPPHGSKLLVKHSLDSA